MNTRTQPPLDYSEISSGKPLLTIQRTAEILEEMNIKLSFNVISHQMIISGDGVDQFCSAEDAYTQLPFALWDYLRFHYKVSKQDMAEFLACVALQNKFNPLHSLVESFTWDGCDYFEDLCACLRLPPEDTLSRTLLRKWMRQALSLGLYNRTAQPFGADGILVLNGPQGIGKTSIVRTLSLLPALTLLEAHLDFHDKDTLLRATAVWVCELSELEQTTRSDPEALKAFLTCDVDRVRPPYGRSDRVAPRRTAFIGTCNSTGFLRDETGSRRFWVIPLQSVDLEALEALNIVELWLQIYEEVRRDPQSFRLTREERAALEQRNTAYAAPLKAQSEVEDALFEAEQHPERFEWAEITVSDFKSYFPQLHRYSASDIGKALNRIGIEANQKKLSGQKIRIRRLPKRKPYDVIP